MRPVELPARNAQAPERSDDHARAAPVRQQASPGRT